MLFLLMTITNEPIKYQLFHQFIFEHHKQASTTIRELEKIERKWKWSKNTNHALRYEWNGGNKTLYEKDI